MVDLSLNMRTDIFLSLFIFRDIKTRNYKYSKQFALLVFMQ